MFYTQEGISSRRPTTHCQCRISICEERLFPPSIILHNTHRSGFLGNYPSAVCNNHQLVKYQLNTRNQSNIIHYIFISSKAIRKFKKKSLYNYYILFSAVSLLFSLSSLSKHDMLWFIESFVSTVNRKSDICPVWHV